MDCRGIEEKLSEYLERSLPAPDMARVAEHLNECRQCSMLLDEMRLVVLACKAFPTLEPDVALIERILLRTSGKPRTRPWRELMQEYLVGPMLTPRFAVGAVLSLLFFVFALNLMLPRMSVVASVLSPRELVRQMDRGVQRIYSEGLKAYDKKNEWQAQFGFIRNNVFNKLGFMIEQLDVPVEGNKKKSGEPRQQQEKAPSDKRSLLLLPA